MDRARDGDTSRDALRARYAALRRLSPRARLALMDDLTGFVRSLTREGIRLRHPGASEEELDRLFAEQVLGKDLADRVRAHRRSS